MPALSQSLWCTWYIVFSWVSQYNRPVQMGPPYELDFKPDAPYTSLHNAPVATLSTHLSYAFATTVGIANFHPR